MTLFLADLGTLTPKEGIISRDNTILIQLNWKLRLLPGCFGLLMPPSPQAKKEVMRLIGVIDLDYKGEIELLLQKNGFVLVPWAVI